MSSLPPDDSIADYRHDETRTALPYAALSDRTRVKEAKKKEWEYDPHLPPVLRWDEKATAERILQKAAHSALDAEELNDLSRLLEQQKPWLEWTSKREKPAAAIEPVALHLHERVSTHAILKMAARQDVARNLFADPEEDYREAVKAYEHEVQWANRLILGDSLQGMTSLAQRENLAGKVQCIYFDPPYGIKFASNFQSEVGKRDVKDRDEDLTREPEVVKAYRDTWTLGVHSYLTYLRDRLTAARDLLTDSGSIFVQISDENLHRVRILLDEVFGTENFCSQIVFKKTGGQASDMLASVADHILWYARERKKVKNRTLFRSKEGDERPSIYRMIDDTRNGNRTKIGMDIEMILKSPHFYRIFAPDTLVSLGATPKGTVSFPHQNKDFFPGNGQHWKTTIGGLNRLQKCDRLINVSTSLYYVRYLDDFPVIPFDNIWNDTSAGGYSDDKVYVVQTNRKVIERCILMTTDPGDLVLDPTCGSGTTAYVAEQWGRRWITIDTSRVAIAIARQRLLTAKFDYYQLADQKEPKGGFLYKTVPHITLKSIAQNPALDPVFARWEPILEAKLERLNAALADISADLPNRLKLKLATKEQRDGKKSITDADRRRWLLPSPAVWQEWEVPFDTDPDDWTPALCAALTDYRTAWRGKMDEVNATIAASAEQEELVDKPVIVRNVLRVSGPFTVEGVIPAEESLDVGETGDLLEDETGEGLETFETPEPAYHAATHRDQLLAYLRSDGVRFVENKVVKFSFLEPVHNSAIQAQGQWGEERQAAILLGPQIGGINTKMVMEALRYANRKGYDDLIIAGYSFDAEAHALIQEEQENAKSNELQLHTAHIRPDTQMGDLLKTPPNSQIFTVTGSPRTELRKAKNGEWEIEMQGVDIYDPVANVIQSANAGKVAAWFLDSDYDGKCFCITQAFFPDKKAWEKLSKTLIGVVDAERFEAFSGTVSLPFPTGRHGKAAVKVIDPRGNEVMRVMNLEQEGELTY